MNFSCVAILYSENIFSSEPPEYFAIGRVPVIGSVSFRKAAKINVNQIMFIYMRLIMCRSGDIQLIKHLFSIRSLSQKGPDHVGHNGLSETPRSGDADISSVIRFDRLQNLIKKSCLVYKKSG